MQLLSVDQGMADAIINNSAESIHEGMDDFLLQRVNAFLLPILLPIPAGKKRAKKVKGTNIYFKTLHFFSFFCKTLR